MEIKGLIFGIPLSEIRIQNGITIGVSVVHFWTWIGAINHIKQLVLERWKLCRFAQSEPKTTGNLNNQKPPWRSEQPTTKNHRGGASRPLGSSLLPWRSEQRKTTGNLNNQKPPWRSEQPTTKNHHGGGSPPDRWDRRCCRGDLNNEKPSGNLKKEQPKTTVVRASRRGLGGYRSEQRATPWVSPWWWLASVGPDLRKEPWVSPGGGWWFQVVAGC
uniref:Uncharacterized protein n=1 Tax=Fagus sylvatica TaxID=28930 RepID=A0A2N9HFX0_FAGSY